LDVWLGVNILPAGSVNPTGKAKTKITLEKKRSSSPDTKKNRPELFGSQGLRKRWWEEEI